MRILVVGAYDFDIYESAAADALERVGHSVLRLSHSQFLIGPTAVIERRGLAAGPGIRRFNRALIAAISDFLPDAVLIWRGVYVQPTTLARIRQRSPALLVSYNNDNPFAQSKRSVWLRHYWRYYLKGIPSCDINLVYRPENIADAQSRGSRKTDVMMPAFIPSRDYPVSLSVADEDVWRSDAVYVGHFEDDGRTAYLNELTARGLTVRVYGSKQSWTARARAQLTADVGEIRVLSAAEYRKAVAGSGFALCFLSSLNRDVYTRRCFEIPAMGGLLVAPRTPELASLFRDGAEAVLFGDARELGERCHGLRGDPARLTAMRRAGLARVHADGHSIDDRMRWFVALVTASRRSRH
jgi:spore maturation protein CgeB